jgi:hypothetical protein
LIGNLLAVAVLVMRADPSLDPRAANLALEFEPCVGVDESVVRDLVELEVRDAPARDAAAPIRVAVRCVETGQEIRVEPWASLGADGVRAIDLPPADPADPAAREARVRELALAIAELVRRLEMTHPLAAPATAPAPPPPPSPSGAIAAVPPAPEETRARWRVGMLAAFERFAGGQSLAGGDLTLAVSGGPWVWGQVRLGGRVGPETSWPGGRATARAGTASVAAAWNLCPGCRSIELALLARLQGYLVEYRVDTSGLATPTSTVTSPVMGAIIACAEPHLRIAVGRGVSLVAAVAAGLPLHGIVLQAQGTRLASVTGPVLSGHLGAAVSF